MDDGLSSKHLLSFARCNQQLAEWKRLMSDTTIGSDPSKVAQFKRMQALTFYVCGNGMATKMREKARIKKKVLTCHDMLRMYDKAQHAINKNEVNLRAHVEKAAAAILYKSMCSSPDSEVVNHANRLVRDAGLVGGRRKSRRARIRRTRSKRRKTSSARRH